MSPYRGDQEMSGLGAATWLVGAAILTALAILTWLLVWL